MLGTVTQLYDERGATDAFTKKLASNLLQKGIRVNAVGTTGPVRTHCFSPTSRRARSPASSATPT